MEWQPATRHTEMKSTGLEMKTKQQLAGIIPPLATPLLDADQVDVHGTARLVEHVIAGGVHGIFILGTTGEGTSLTQGLRHQFVELVSEIVAGRVPLLVGVTDTSMVDALELAEQSYAAGAAAVVTAAPYYLPMSQADLLRYTEELATRLPLPALLYNMPSCTKTEFSIETIQRLSQHPNIIGLKDTSGDLEYYAQAAEIANRIDDFTLLIGPEEKLARSLELGGHGGVSGGANFFPRLYVELYNAAAQGEPGRASELQQLILEVSKAIYGVSDSGARVLQGVKTALAELGICSHIVAPPFRTYDEAERLLIRNALARLTPLVESACDLPSRPLPSTAAGS